MPRELFHLPDLPTVGYSTRRQREGTDAIMLFMRGIERDRLRLLNIVLEGRETWRRIARQVFGSALSIDTDALDAMYDYFTLQAAWPSAQRALLDAEKAGNTLRWRAIVKAITPKIEEQREHLRLMAKWGA